MIEYGRANDMPWERSVVFITSNVGTGLSMQIAQDRAKVWLCSTPRRRASRCGGEPSWPLVAAPGRGCTIAVSSAHLQACDMRVACQGVPQS